MILRKEKTFWVLDKPAGMSVHNGTKESPDLLQFLKQKYPQYQFHLPHRLDKETSGIIVVALDAEVAYDLQTAFQNESTQKIYQCVLRGNLKEEKGTWNAALSDKAEGRKNPQGLLKDRKPCSTDFEVLERSKYFTLVQCEIHTGRQHQIRKHAAFAGHSIVGDPRYNEPNYNTKIASVYETDRLFLHASYMKFKYHSTVYELSSHQPKEFKRLMNEKA